MISVEKIDYEKFKPFLESLDLISASLEWADFIGRSLGGRPCYFGIFENGRLSFIVPAFETVAKELIGVPKLYTELIVYDGNEKIPPTIDILAFFGKNQVFSSIKFSICPILNLNFSIPEETGVKMKRMTHILKPKTFDENEILTRIISHKTRNQIITAGKRGNFEVKIGNLSDEFYKLYLVSIKRLKSTPKEFGFFSNLEKSFKENLRIIFAYRGQALAGANLALIKNKYLHLMFNVSDARFFKDNINDFIYWETIRFGLAKGIEIFDFGPSSIRDKSHHHFKEGFGAKPVPIYDFVSYNSLARRLNDFISKKARNLKLKIKKSINF